MIKKIFLSLLLMSSLFAYETEEAIKAKQLKMKQYLYSLFDNCRENELGKVGVLDFYNLDKFNPITESKKVTEDTLKGGISIYLMIGILWYMFYELILLIDVDAFSIQIENLETYKLVYFSYTTLTTLGYGDISPLNKLAMALANLEAIIGQMYPAIFIARLVTLYDND